MLTKKKDDFHALVIKELPDFMTQIALLLIAGIPLTAAWERSLEDIASASDLDKEMRQVLRDTRQGMAFAQALEALARRRPYPEIQMFVMVMSQNVKRKMMI